MMQINSPLTAQMHETPMMYCRPASGMLLKTENTAHPKTRRIIEESNWNSVPSIYSAISIPSGSLPVPVLSVALLFELSSIVPEGLVTRFMPELDPVEVVPL